MAASRTQPRSHTPTISVVVPTFDVVEYVAEALGSLGSTTTDIEVVVVDDGSTDGTLDEVQRAVEGLDATVVGSEHGGAGPARNAGIERARGEWVAFLDSDDRMAEGGLDLLLAAATSEPDVDVVVADLRRFPSGVGKERFTWQRMFAEAPVTIDDASELEHLVYAAGPTNKLFRREAVERIGARFGETGAFEDGFFTIPMYLGARRIRVIPDVVYEYRVREQRDGLMDDLFARPSNYLDHLALAAFLADLAADEDPARRDWLHRWVVRQNLPFLERADGVLDAAQRDRLIELAHTALRDVDPALLARFARPVGRRAGAIAALEADPGLLPASPPVAVASEHGWRLAGTIRDPRAAVLAGLEGARFVATEARATDGGLEIAAELRDASGDRLRLSADAELRLLAGTQDGTATVTSAGRLRATLPVGALPTAELPLVVAAAGMDGTTPLDAGRLGTRRVGLRWARFVGDVVDVIGPTRPRAVLTELGRSLRARRPRSS